MLEPFAHIRVVVTATEWGNFFGLRMHPDAQPEIQELARCMYQAMMESQPNVLHPGQWHLPYITEEDADLTIHQKIRVSVARCARVSYRLHDGTRTTLEKDLQLYDQLIKADPAHASPCEHQAIAMNSALAPSRNFLGWWQLREQLGV